MSDGGFVWGGDDAADDDTGDDAGSRTEPPSSENVDAPPSEDVDAPSPFEDLLGRIDAQEDRLPDAEDLGEIPPRDGARYDQVTVDHLFERVGDERGERTEPSGPTDGDAVSGLPDADSTPGESGSTDGRRPRPAGDEAGSGPDPDDPSPVGRSSPFGDMAERVATDAESTSQRDRLGTGGAIDRTRVPSDATNVLLLGHLDSDAALEVCLSHLRERPPGRTNLLFVWLTRDAGTRLARLYDSYAEPSTTVTVVCRSDIDHVLRANPSIPTDDPTSSLTVERVSDPRDLTKLGIAINRVISDWASGPKRPVMCFHSLTDLLQFEDHERVFRFLHVLGGRMNSIGARAYYHLDPSELDPRTVATFRNLFDATVDLATDGVPDDE